MLKDKFFAKCEDYEVNLKISGYITRRQLQVTLNNIFNFKVSLKLLHEAIKNRTPIHVTRRDNQLISK